MKIILALIATLFISKLAPVLNNQTQAQVVQQVAVKVQPTVADVPAPTQVIETVQVQETPIRGSHEDILTTTGIPRDQWYAVEYILGNESTDWCPTRVQGYHGNCLDYVPNFQEDNNTVGYGICQSTPANKMAKYGSDWRSNVYTQMKWCNGYAIERYGNWHNAYTFWTRNHWW